jgi:hypothetical protein
MRVDELLTASGDLGVTVEISTERQEEMKRAAAIAVAIALAEKADRPIRSNGHAKRKSNGHISAWVVRARVLMTNRWPG